MEVIIQEASPLFHMAQAGAAAPTSCDQGGRKAGEAAKGRPSARRQRRRVS